MSVTGLRYPWTVLGLPPTQDERAIRKAYAAKLRVTRPDENPRGFQELREARDAALAERRYLEPVEIPVEPITEPASIPDRHWPVADNGGRHEPEIASNPGGGAVMLDGRLETSGMVVHDVAPDLAERLEQVGTPHPWRDLKAQWADVFDAMEQASLANHPYNMWIVLQRLIGDLRLRVGHIPDVTDWQLDPRAGERGQFGVHADILRDFESRFGILKQDTVLLEYLNEEDARDFINALTISVGRDRAPQPMQRPVINVEAIDADYVHAAWGDDEKMRDYYERARQTDGFPVSFSWLALLFPLPFALYHRLTAIAVLLAILIVANTGFYVMQGRGIAVPFGPMVATVYLITAGALAFNWRRIRVQALVSRVRRLTGQGLGSPDIRADVRQANRPNLTGMWGGIAALILVAAIRFYSR